jgi:hypothetical protein
MSESLQLRDPLFRLIIRFSNGEQVEHVMTDAVHTRAIAPETKYAIISLSSRQNPSICTEITVINLRDVSYIKSERVTLEQLAAEHRIGIRSAGLADADDRLPKNIAQIQFV